MKVFAIALMLSLAASTGGTVGALGYVFPDCPTEDSSWCVWDAQHQGDGQGKSFIDINGHVFYLD